MSILLSFYKIKTMSGSHDSIFGELEIVHPVIFQRPIPLPAVFLGFFALTRAVSRIDRDEIKRCHVSNLFMNTGLKRPTGDDVQDVGADNDVWRAVESFFVFLIREPVGVIAEILEPEALYELLSQLGIPATTEIQDSWPSLS